MRACASMAAAAFVLAAAACGTDEKPPSAAEPTPWPPIPELRGIPPDEAEDRLEAAGWSTRDAERPGDHLYAWFGPRGSARRPTEAAVTCGGEITAFYILNVTWATAVEGCPRIRGARAMRLAVLDARGRKRGLLWVVGKDGGWASWFDLRVPNGEHPRAILQPGTCGRAGGQPPEAVTHEVAHSFDELASTQWALVAYVRTARLCAVHRGTELLRPSSASESTPNTGKVRREAHRLTVSLSDGTVRLVPEGAGTRIHVEYAAIGGSSPSPLHIRRGRCETDVFRGVIPLSDLEPDADNDRAESTTVVDVPFASLVRRRHALEISGGGCAEFGG